MCGFRVSLYSVRSDFAFRWLLLVLEGEFVIMTEKTSLVCAMLFV